MSRVPLNVSCLCQSTQPVHTYQSKTMAPSKSLQKLLKVKPAKPLQLDPDEDPNAPEEIIYGTQKPTIQLPPVTAAERQRWAEARALQQSDERGQPVEGWAKRLATMEADGRLYRIGNTLHQRGVINAERLPVN